MSAMARRTRPQPRLPPELETAVGAFGSREDLALLAFLGSVETALSSEIADVTQMATMTVHRHLVDLEDLGLVRGNTPQGGRRGRSVRYSLDRVQTAAMIDSLRAALLGDDG
jgi:DNA-binding MarR family transcriptional regulator